MSELHKQEWEYKNDIKYVYGGHYECFLQNSSFSGKSIFFAIKMFSEIHNKTWIMP